MFVRCSSQYTTGAVGSAFASGIAENLVRHDVVPPTGVRTNGFGPGPTYGSGMGIVGPPIMSMAGRYWGHFASGPYGGIPSPLIYNGMKSGFGYNGGMGSGFSYGGEIRGFEAGASTPMGMSATYGVIGPSFPNFDYGGGIGTIGAPVRGIFGGYGLRSGLGYSSGTVMASRGGEESSNGILPEYRTGVVPYSPVRASTVSAPTEEPAPQPTAINDNTNTNTNTNININHDMGKRRRDRLFNRAILRSIRL